MPMTEESITETEEEVQTEPLEPLDAAQEQPAEPMEGTELSVRSLLAAVRSARSSGDGAALITLLHPLLQLARAR